MTVLKFWKKNSDIFLDDLFMKDITKDSRTALLNKQSMMTKKYKISDGVYMIKCDFFMKMARLLNKQLIYASLIRVDDEFIIIVRPGDYVFFDGHSVEPEDYNIFQNNQYDQSIINKIKSGPIEDG